MGEMWINVAMVLTAFAGALLAFLIHPAQRDGLAGPTTAGGDAASRCSPSSTTCCGRWSSS
jgi:hypothetical protein